MFAQVAAVDTEPLPRYEYEADDDLSSLGFCA
jgi:hypothetical protein